MSILCLDKFTTCTPFNTVQINALLTFGFEPPLGLRCLVVFRTTRTNSAKVQETLKKFDFQKLYRF